MLDVNQTGHPTNIAVAPHRFAGWASIASGVVGIIALACLVAYLATQARTFVQTGVMPPTGWLLLTANKTGALLQALLMIPAAIAVLEAGRRGSASLSRAVAVVGCLGLAVVVLVRVGILLSPAVSDILFMGPIGFVGVWLIAVNWLLAGRLSLATRIVGTIAGLGLVIVGASFFFLGGLAVLTDGPYAYGKDVDFHVGIRIGGAPGFILFPIWSALLGRALLRKEMTRDRPVRMHAAATALALVALLAQVPGWAQPAADSEKQLITLQDRWAKARVARDVAFLERLYAKEFRITAMNGTIVERDADIAKFASGELKPESITDEDLKVSLYGDVALVTGRENMRGPYQGRSFELSIRFTNVFVWRDGRWQLVAHHSTPAGRQ
jgi:ketosteroid isomerase-like protein